ncbi:centrosomal protein of 104 kDa-like [Tubulanus polymorphus]|uniref:centrosomal protein of 104 kDa-like n=1 Tax=Tubulanus polymorphus TaxID=672921 RepID=UPI003DA39D21
MPRKVPFHVIHVSGQDDLHKAAELNTHSPITKGWQSQRFCLYPQDLVIQLEKRCRLRKIQLLSHQYLIATKVEFYVGDVPEGTPVSLQNARYTRLGYVALSDNEKTGFKARELKSVHVDAIGMYLKLVIHKNHVNKHNLYNQISIVAINVIGDEVKSDPDSVYLPTEPHDMLQTDPVLAGIFSRPDYISPLDDLAFDMYQDPEVAQIIRRLEVKKQEAVLEERFDLAKKLKVAIQELQKVGEKLGRFEVEKRQAVENEDYDKAKLKKVQMDEYRLQVYKELEIHDLLEFTISRHPVVSDIDYRSHTPARLTPVLTDYDDRPLPAIRNLDVLPPVQSNQSLNHHHKPLETEDSSILLTRSARGEENTAPVPVRPTRHNTAAAAAAKSSSSLASFDDKPCKAAHNTSPVALDMYAEPVPKQQSPPTPLPPLESDRPLPKIAAQPIPDDEDEIGLTGEPEPMNEKDLREAGSVIDVFGLPLVSKAYSKTWSFREDALLAIYKLMSELPTTATKDDSKAMFRAACFLVVKGIKDQVFAVFKAALNLLKYMLVEYVPNHKIPRADTHTCAEKTIRALIQKSGDTAVRNRDIAKSYILEMSQYPEVKPIQVVPTECVKPFKLTIAPRLALSRTEVIHQLYKELTLNDSGLTLDNMMKYCMQAIEHTAGEVREEAERIIVALYKEVGEPVKDYLPPDDDRTRKNVLYRLLFEAFDKIDGKPSKDDLKRQKQDEELRKQKEIEALQHQLAQLKEVTSGKNAAHEDSPRREAPTKQKKGTDNKKGDKKAASEAVEDEAVDFDSNCIFCGEKDESFSKKQGLDMHYWKSCPMLKRCANCKQVVEIAGLTEHLLEECNAKDNYVKCPRCTEAIPKPEYEQHVKEELCVPAKKNEQHCPLCHNNIPPGEEGWKEHLMGSYGCKQNPRRLLALEKQKDKGKVTSRGRGKAITGQPKGKAVGAKR